MFYFISVVLHDWLKDDNISQRW